MGNKQSKALYKCIDKATFKDSPGIKLNFLTLYENGTILDYVKESQLDKILKAGDLQAFENIKVSNIPKDYYSKELETKRKKHREMLRRSILVAGHEKHSQVDFILEGLEEPPEEYLDMSCKYTSDFINEFATFLLLLRNLKESSEQFLPFQQRLIKCIKSSPRTEEGASAALSLTSLLLDPKHIHENTQVVGQTLTLFKDIPILGLYGWTMQALNVEKALGRIKACLIQLLKDSKDETLLKNSALALCHIGLATGTLDDLILAIYYINVKKLEFPDHIINSLIDKVEGLKLDIYDSSLNNFQLNSSKIQEIFPFERLYLGIAKSDYDNMVLSLTTDGEFAYIFSSIDGIHMLGIGKNKNFGKLYSSIPVETKDPMKLLCLNKKLYAVIKNELFRINKETGKLKSTKKSQCFTKYSKSIISSQGKYIVIYTEKDEINVKENEGIQADISYYDTKTKQLYKKYTISHSLNNKKEIIVCGAIVMLLTTKQYIIYDLENNKKLKEDDSNLLSNSSVCLNADTGDIYIIHLTSSKEGLELIKMKPINIGIQEETIDKTLINDKLNDPNFIRKKNKDDVSSLLGFYVPPSEVSTIPSSKEASDHLWNKMLSLLVKRASISVKFTKNSTLNTPEQVFKAFKSPLGIHLSGRSIETLLDFLKYLYDRSKNEGINWSIVNIIKLLNSHVQAMQICELTLKGCGGESLVNRSKEIFSEIIENIITNKDKLNGDNDVIETLIKECKSLLKNVSVTFLDDYSKVLKMLIDIVESKSEDKENIMTIASWLTSQKNQMLIAEKIFESKNMIGIDFMDAYFKIEGKYLAEKINKFLKKDSKELEFIEFVKNELSYGVRLILEKSLVIFL